MLRFIIKIVIFFKLFENLNSQIHLNQTSISVLCYCNPPSSREINLSYKNIKTVDPSTFDGLYLQKLYLHFNEITSIDPSTFNGLTFLQLLELSSNKISFIDPATFNGLKSLQFLLLAQNEIASIDPSTFNGLTSLYDLRLHSNQISSIDPATFNGLASLAASPASSRSTASRPAWTAATAFATPSSRARSSAASLQTSSLIAAISMICTHNKTTARLGTYTFFGPLQPTSPLARLGWATASADPFKRIGVYIRSFISTNTPQSSSKAFTLQHFFKRTHMPQKTTHLLR